MSKLIELQDAFLTADWKENGEIAEKLLADHSEASIPFFIECLRHEQARVRNRAALCLKDVKCNAAVEPIIDAVLNPIDEEACGTLVYALESLDCSDHLIDLFKIMFFRNAECKINAHDVLAEQPFAFDDDDLKQVVALWQACIDDPSQCPDFDKFREYIQSDIDGFLGHLDDAAGTAS